MQIVQRLGCFAEVGGQLRSRHSRHTGFAAFAQPVAQAALGQVHDDIHPVLFRIISVRADEEVMMQLLDDVEGFLLAQPLLMVGRPADDLDGDGEAARCEGTPHFR